MLALYLFIGRAVSTSDGSSPQVYVRLLVVGHRLEVEFRELLLDPKSFQSKMVRGVRSPLEKCICRSAV